MPSSTLAAPNPIPDVDGLPFRQIQHFYDVIILKRSFKRLELENHDAIESKVVGRAVNDVLSYKMYWSVKRFLL